MKTPSSEWFNLLKLGGVSFFSSIKILKSVMMGATPLRKKAID